MSVTTGVTGRIVRRRLGAVLFADVVGYTRLMAADEDATYGALRRLLVRLEETCRAYEGEVAEIRGDGVYAVFETATGAVRFAVDMQRRIEEESASLPEDRRIRFRVGVHLGEFLVDDRGVHGDSVNTAARLQEIGEPGQVFISATVHEQIRNRLRLGYEFLGARALKNLPEPVPVFRVRAEVEGVTLAASRRPEEPLRTVPMPELPSVAVLPFEARGGEEEVWLADGITEDITQALSKFRNLFVIARNSAFFFRAREVPVEEAARSLGVRYVASGSVRRAGSRLRVAVTLADTEVGRTIWGERYDRDLDDVFAIQDEVTEAITAATAVVIEAQERQRTGTLPNSLAAYGYVLQGQSHVYKYTRSDNRAAQNLYERALDTDRTYARAAAALSRTLNLDWRYHWSDREGDVLDVALRYAREAVELDPTDARGFGELGFVHLYRKEHDSALTVYRRAMTLNPNDADLMSDYGDALAHAGHNEEAIALLERAMRLNPFFPDQYLWHLGGAYYNMKAYDRVIEAVSRMNNPTEGQRLLAASYAQLGKMDVARDIAAKHKQAHPNFSLEHWSKVVPDRSEEDLMHFYEGLKKAGF